MVPQFSTSVKPKSIFLLFALLSIASCSKVLIICTEGCGCVTERGKSVRCPFIPLNETAVLQSNLLENGSYRATRVIYIGTTFGYGNDEEESFDEYCPDAAGSIVKASSVCFRAPKPTRILPKPTLPQGSPKKVSTYSGKCMVGQFKYGQNAVFAVENHPPPRTYVNDDGEKVSVNGVAFQLAACRAKPLKK